MTRGDSTLQLALRAALSAAMKRRDRAAVAVYRATIAAIDNAEAVDAPDAAGAIEFAPAGVGRSDVARRALTEEEVIQVVRAEIAERRAAADSLVAARPVDAVRLRQEAELLATLVDEDTPS